MGIRRSAAEYGSGISDQQVSVTSSPAVSLTVPATAIAAMVTNGAEPIRVRWGTPTASVGHYLNPYSVMDLYQDDLGDVKFIAVSSTSTIDVTYFG